MITIGKSGLNVSLTNEEINSFSSDFRQNHFIRLPNLLDEQLLQIFCSEIETAEWKERAHDHIGVEVCLRDPDIPSLMNFLLNDTDLFRLLERITGCGSIGSFEGRVYRMIPSSGHYDSWHTDDGEHRLLAMSMNLSKEKYDGGVLQIRKRGSDESVIEIPNTDFRSTAIFQIGPVLEHQVTKVEGSVPRTAFAGWFKSQPDIWSTITAAARERRL